MWHFAFLSTMEGKRPPQGCSFFMTSGDKNNHRKYEQMQMKFVSFVLIFLNTVLLLISAQGALKIGKKTPYFYPLISPPTQLSVLLFYSQPGY